MKLLSLFILTGCFATHLSNVTDLRHIQKELDAVELTITRMEQSLSQGNNPVLNDSLDMLYQKRERLLRDRALEQRQANQNFRDDMDSHIYFSEENKKKGKKLLDKY